MAHMRNAKDNVRCTLCGKIIPRGSANFTWNRRGVTGSRHESCSQDPWWNPENGRIDKVEEFGNWRVEFTSRYDGTCAICGKNYKAGVSQIVQCSTVAGFRHTYCAETSSQEQQKSGLNETTNNTVETVQTVQNEQQEHTQNMTQTATTGNPLLDMIWDGIRPKVESISKTASLTEDLQKKLEEQFQVLTDLSKDLQEQLAKRPIVEITVSTEDGREIGRVENPHPLTSEVIKIVTSKFQGRRLIPYLYGAPGGGKSTIARQVAAALNLNFGYLSLNKYSTPSSAIGFVNAQGAIVDTDFTRAYEKGGVLLIDEFDNMSGNLATSLNGALCNGQAAFPAGTIAMHADCIVITTGNTSARGGDSKHNERVKLDDATIDRLVFLEVPYDLELEERLAIQTYDHTDTHRLIELVRKLRKNAADRQMSVTFSPRCCYYGASLLKSGFSFDKTVEMAVRKGLNRDNWSKLQ